MASRFGDKEVVADKKPATVSRFGDDSAYQDEDESFLGSVGRQIMEMPAGAVRAGSEMADLFASPFIAAERQVRPYAQAMLKGEPMPDSLLRKGVSMVELGSGLRLWGQLVKLFQTQWLR